MERIERLVIGAGAAGLAAAEAMARAGRRVVVLDKGRGVGGRLATRRPFLRSGPHPLRQALLDHGAPAAHMAAAPSSQALRWDAINARPRFGFDAAAGPAWVAPNGMAALLAPAEGVELRSGLEVASVERAGDALLVTARQTEGEAELRFEADAAACAIPAPQAARLFAEQAPAAECDADYAPVLSVLAVWDPRDAPAAAGVIWGAEGGALEVAIAQGAKPGATPPETAAAWVGHAAPAWSRAQLELSKAEIADALIAPLAKIAGAKTAPAYLAGHRWRYGRVARAVGSPYWLSEDRRLGLCGDWRLGPTVGHAIESGAALGAAMA